MERRKRQREARGQINRIKKGKKSREAQRQKMEEGMIEEEKISWATATSE